MRNQRHRELGPGTFDGFDVAGVIANIIDDDRLSIKGGCAGYAFAYRNPELFHDVLRITDGEAVVEFLPFLVDEEDREDLVRDNAVREFRDFLQQLIEIENRCDLVVDLNERRKKTRF